MVEKPVNVKGVVCRFVRVIVLEAFVPNTTFPKLRLEFESVTG